MLDQGIEDVMNNDNILERLILYNIVRVDNISSQDTKWNGCLLIHNQSLKDELRARNYFWVACQFGKSP